MKSNFITSKRNNFRVMCIQSIIIINDDFNRAAEAGRFLIDRMRPASKQKNRSGRLQLQFCFGKFFRSRGFAISGTGDNKTGQCSVNMVDGAEFSIQTRLLFHS